MMKPIVEIHIDIIDPAQEEKRRHDKRGDIQLCVILAEEICEQFDHRRA
jgi:hypothetical protein